MNDVHASVRRLVENEAVFRQHNERVQEKLDNLRKLAIQHGQPGLAVSDKLVLHFFCECSDENCRKRVPLSIEEYRTAHKDRNRFTVLCGHEVNKVEKVMQRADKYCVVEKFFTPPEQPESLNTTDVDNT